MKRMCIVLKVFFLALFYCFGMVFSASADICFLPMGGCVSGLDMSEQMPAADDYCTGYGPKYNGSGWDCSDTCTTNGHTYFRCVEKPCEDGYEPGIRNCDRGYVYETNNEYSGDLICGKCTEDECPNSTQLSTVCEQDGYVAVRTQYYVGEQVCYLCMDDNCDEGMKKSCDAGSELALRTTRTSAGSLCYECCNNECEGNASTTEPDCGEKSAVVVGETACGKSCYTCEE